MEEEGKKVGGPCSGLAAEHSLLAMAGLAVGDLGLNPNSSRLLTG